jgi:Cu/Ag efflux protein CusF
MKLGTIAAAVVVASVATTAILGGASATQQRAPAQTAQAPSQPSTAQAPSVPAPMVSGTVEKVDAAAGKITIDHGPIPNLNMAAMTMVFQARDPAMLKQVKRGDKVRFTAERVNGQITVTKIQKGPAQRRSGRGGARR